MNDLERNRADSTPKIRRPTTDSFFPNELHFCPDNRAFVAFNACLVILTDKLTPPEFQSFAILKAGLTQRSRRFAFFARHFSQRV
jgi:hypothetical protein